MKSERISSPASPSSAALDITELGRTFNSAVLSSRAARIRRNATRSAAPLPGMREVLGSPAYQAILTAVRLHSRSEGISEKEASERVIEAFRRLDELWEENVFLEGLSKLKTSG